MNSKIIKTIEAAHCIRNTFGKNVSNQVSQFWFSRFTTDNETIEDELRQGYPEKMKISKKISFEVLVQYV